ncbi:MAG: hypothetical protein K2N18_04050, partial [Clostridia bacterium]|nr:hypothetical protein [Clostridia bacterium]
HTEFTSADCLPRERRTLKKRKHNGVPTNAPVCGVKFEWWEKYRLDRKEGVILFRVHATHFCRGRNKQGRGGFLF